MEPELAAERVVGAEDRVRVSPVLASFLRQQGVPVKKAEVVRLEAAPGGQDKPSNLQRSLTAWIPAKNLERKRASAV